MLCSGAENSFDGKVGLTQLHKLRPYEVKTVAQAFLEIISRKVAWFKVCSGAFFSRAEGTFFRWHDLILDISGMGIMCFGERTISVLLKSPESYT